MNDNRELKIDFVAPPYAGHLFPILQLAKGLKDREFDKIRIISTPRARHASELCGLRSIELLKNRDDDVEAIANTKIQVGSNPLRMLGQLKSNLNLMREFKNDLTAIWEDEKSAKPDLVIADLTVPLAGILAQDHGIRWWTSMPSPCAIETRKGTPAYLGGWSPPNSFLGKTRDVFGRLLIRTFKKTIGFVFRKQLRSLGFESVYRSDGCENVYSPETILGLGIEEFEFERDWPESLEFIGPLTASPQFPHVELDLQKDNSNILISLGTHLFWAKSKAKELFREVARQMPDFEFYFTLGKFDDRTNNNEGNWHEVGYLPYDKFKDCFDIAVIHGGTGVLYSCLSAGIPILVWPHDYDQFDHAARIVHHGLGLRLRPAVSKIVDDIRQLHTSGSVRTQSNLFSSLIGQSDPIETVVELLQKKRRDS